MSREPAVEPVEIELPGSLAPQVNLMDNLLDADNPVEVSRQAAIERLTTQAQANRYGVTIVRIEGAEPVVGFTYNPFPDPANGITGTMMETFTIAEAEMANTEFTVPADVAIKAVSCFRCNRARSLHGAPEQTCKRCFKGVSYHTLIKDVPRCADGKPMVTGDSAVHPHCADGREGSFHFTVSPSSRVQLKDDMTPEMRQQPPKQTDAAREVAKATPPVEGEQA